MIPKVNWFLESDIYGDDIKGLVEEISKIAIEDWLEIYED